MGQFGFSSVNPRFGTKKSKRHESTQKKFWTKTKNTCAAMRHQIMKFEAFWRTIHVE
jgi:hypothetical protein